MVRIMLKLKFEAREISKAIDVFTGVGCRLVGLSTFLDGISAHVLKPISFSHVFVCASFTSDTRVSQFGYVASFSLWQPSLTSPSFICVRLGCAWEQLTDLPLDKSLSFGLTNKLLLLKNYTVWK